MTTLPPNKESSPAERWDWLTQNVTQQMEKALYREAYRITRNHEDASDVMQEAMIRGAMKCWQLRDENKIFQWMFTIVRREACSLKSKVSPQTLWYGLKLTTGVFCKSGGLEDVLLHDIEKRKLQRAFDQLKSPAKEIVLMKATTDLTLLEIANELHLNYHTVRSCYRRTLTYLKKQLEEENDEKD